MSSDDEKDEVGVAEEVAEEPKEKVDKDLLKVYVGGLPFKAEKHNVREHFSKCGEIDWLHMPLDSQERSRGIAFISYWSEESVEKALKLNGTTFGKREHVIKVNMAANKPSKQQMAEAAASRELEKAAKLEEQAREEKEKLKKKSSKDRKVFIGNIPFACSADTLKKDFSACGKIQSCVMPTGSGGTSKGIAFVTFKDQESVAEAMKFHESDYGGQKLTVRLACDRVEKGKLKGVPRTEAEQARGKEGEANPLEVIVKGLAFGSKEQVLMETFSDCGECTVRMPVNKKGKSYGFAFLTFQDAKGVKKALKLTGSDVAGRPCTVERLGESSKKRSAEPEGEAEEEAVPKKKKKKVAEEEEVAEDLLGLEEEA